MGVPPFDLARSREDSKIGPKRGEMIFNAMQKRAGGSANGTYPVRARGGLAHGAPGRVARRCLARARGSGSR